MEAEASGFLTDMNPELENLLVMPDTPVREAIGHLNRGGKGIVMTVDEERRLLGTVTDGDIRRAVLAGMDLDKPVSALLDRMRLLSNSKPVTASADTERLVLIEIMREQSVRQIPLVDDLKRVCGLVTIDELIAPSDDGDLSISAVVMAGGLGTRLRPLTENLPKPMLPVQGEPIMERTIRQLALSGIKHVSVTTHYKPDAIIKHFGDGKSMGVEIEYVKEEHPLGTAGSLKLIAPSDEPMLVINGDILTDLNFRSMLTFHKEQKADLTMGLAQYQIQVPYGVVDVDQLEVQKIEEKPTITLLINAGVYLLNRIALDYIPDNRRFDMTDLIDVLRAEGHSVIGFPICEYWLDIGRLEDYQRAQSLTERHSA